MPTAPPRRILLIDDDEVIAGTLFHALVDGGDAVDVAEDPATAARLMSKCVYDVVLVDPYLTGAVHRDTPPLVDSVTSLQPSAALVVLTGYDFPAIRPPATLLNKPQSIPYLVDLVSQLPQNVDSARARHESEYPE